MRAGGVRHCPRGVRRDAARPPLAAAAVRPRIHRGGSQGACRRSAPEPAPLTFSLLCVSLTAHAHGCIVLLPQVFPQTTPLQSLGFAARAMSRAFEPGDALPAVMISKVPISLLLVAEIASWPNGISRVRLEGGLKDRTLRGRSGRGSRNSSAAATRSRWRPRRSSACSCSTASQWWIFRSCRTRWMSLESRCVHCNRSRDAMRGASQRTMCYTERAVGAHFYVAQVQRISGGRSAQQAALEQLCEVVVNGADSVRKAECVQACLELGAAL